MFDDHDYQRHATTGGCEPTACPRAERHKAHRVRARSGVVAATLVASGLTTLALGAGAAAAATAGLPSGCAMDGAGTVTCTWTSGDNAFTMPTGLLSVHVTLVGGTGGTATSPTGAVTPGGRGAVVSGDLPVTGGTTLNVVVGGNGAQLSPTTLAGGQNGGGGSVSGCGASGGGASDIRLGDADVSSRIVVAGGGGGADANMQAVTSVSRA